jgi:hypothetical protein
VEEPSRFKGFCCMPEEPAAFSLFGIRELYSRPSAELKDSIIYLIL